MNAEDLKAAGNALFKDGHYALAVEKYTKAINAPDAEGSIHILLTNRAFAHAKQENLGLAIEDATRAISISPSYPKAYFRRGSALVALNRFKEALRDFQIVSKLCPLDAEAASKVKECKKEIQYQAFAAAIGRADEIEQFVDPISAFPVEPSYTGPRYEGPGNFSASWIKEFCDWMKQERLPHKQFAYRIIQDSMSLLAKDASLVQVPLVRGGSHFTVCGDIHGQFYDLLNIFEINGYPSETNPYLFNGDFVDRGSFSVECILTLFACKLAFPNSFFLARGNHETCAMNRLYGFEGEIAAKYDEGLYKLACAAFRQLPVAHVIGEAVFVAHGGLFSSDEVTIADIAKISRNCEPGEEGLLTEILWADPMPAKGRAPSKRGVGLSFGPDVTESFLSRNGLQLVIRSHEMKDRGYEIEHGGKLVTVFSAPNYCDQMGNLGAFVKVSLDNDGKVITEYKSFSAVPHPSKRAMCYANRMLFGQ